MFHNLFLEKLNKVIQSNTVISISGEGGTGKSTLALYLISTKLIAERIGSESCVWIQASDFFPKKRLLSMFPDNNGEFLLQNIFVAPEKPFSSYSAQSTFLQKLSQNDYSLPPTSKYIVIDNISHHLRLTASNCNNAQERILLLNDFYNSALFPLILKCQREETSLFLVHEVSYDINLQKNRKFFYKLYDRIRSVEIVLLKSHFNSERSIELYTNGLKSTAGVKISENGLTFII
ncbi:MAG: hypothetical protein ACXACO_22520 [Promethearchaeota archaeon]|jgi:hypothetical protein